MKKKIILLIEDNPLLIGMYEAAFEKEGYAVSIAHDGDSGIALAKQIQPSNIMLDLLMPGTDGFDVIEALKNNPDTRNINIVVLTSDTEPKDLARAKELGAVDCLVKSELTLAEIVEHAVKSFQ